MLKVPGEQRAQELNSRIVEAVNSDVVGVVADDLRVGVRVGGRGGGGGHQQGYYEELYRKEDNMLDEEAGVVVERDRGPFLRQLVWNLDSSKFFISISAPEGYICH